MNFVEFVDSCNATIYGLVISEDANISDIVAKGSVMLSFSLKGHIRSFSRVLLFNSSFIFLKAVLPPIHPMTLCPQGSQMQLWLLMHVLKFCFLFFNLIVNARFDHFDTCVFVSLFWDACPTSLETSHCTCRVK